MDAAVTHQFDNGVKQGMFRILQTGEEVFFSDQRSQCKIGFQRGAWRTDADHRFGGFQQLTKMTFRRIDSGVRLTLDPRFSDALRIVDEIVTEASSVAEEIAVDLTVITVDNAPEFSVAFAGSDVAAQAAMDANRWRGLQIPFPSRNGR